MTSACGFSTNTSKPDGGITPDVDGSIDAPNANIDAPLALPLFATSRAKLYRLDVDLDTSTLVAEIAPAGESPINVDGLALFGSTLLGITAGGGELITIAPETATVTRRVTLRPTNTYAGMTVIPAGDLEPTPVVLSGASNDGKLYRIDPTTGAVATVGSFGASMRLFSDLAWVHGVGLFGSLTGGSCAQVCYARIDPMTGAATVFRADFGTYLSGMSGYRNKLWAFNTTGPVFSVNLTTGDQTLEVNTTIGWTEAAQ